MNRFIPLLFVCCLLGGCLDSAKVQELKTAVANTNATVQSINQQIDSVHEKIKSAPDDTFLGKLNDQLNNLQKEKAEYVALLDGFNHNLQKAENGEDVVVSTITALTPYMGPYGGMVAIGAPLAVGLISNLLKKRKHDQEIAEEKAKTEEETRKGHAAIQNIDHMISGATGGVGKFDLSDPDTKSAMKKLDREAGITDFVAEALK